MNSPSRASRLTPLTAVTSPNCFLMSMVKTEANSTSEGT